MLNSWYCLCFYHSGEYSTDCADSCGSTTLMDSFRGNYVDIASLLMTEVNVLETSAKAELHVMTCQTSACLYKISIKMQEQPFPTQLVVF